MFDGRHHIQPAYGQLRVLKSDCSLMTVFPSHQIAQRLTPTPTQKRAMRLRPKRPTMSNLRAIVRIWRTLSAINASVFNVVKGRWSAGSTVTYAIVTPCLSGLNSKFNASATSMVSMK
jgi:hypothetical protein